MLAKKFRLPIQSFGKPTKTFRGKYFSVKEKWNELPFSRLGIVIGKKVDSRSSRRNKLKRTVFNWAKTRKLIERPGKDILLIADGKAAKLSREEVEKELSELFFR